MTPHPQDLDPYLDLEMYSHLGLTPGFTGLTGLPDLVKDRQSRKERAYDFSHLPNAHEYYQYAVKLHQYPSSSSLKPDYLYCAETQKYEHKSTMIKIKSMSKKLRHGKGRIGFVIFEHSEYTAVRFYDLKAGIELNTILLNGKVKHEDVKKLLFDKAVTLKEAKRKTVKPFKGVFRHIILSKKDFNDKFERNSFNRKKFSAFKDKALISIGDIIKKADGGELVSAHPCGILRRAANVVHKFRSEYDGEFPCVQVYAIWMNYNPETRLINEGEYDVSEPMHYSYCIFETREEMEEYPL